MEDKCRELIKNKKNFYELRSTTGRPLVLLETLTLPYDNYNRRVSLCKLCKHPHFFS